MKTEIKIKNPDLIHCLEHEGLSKSGARRLRRVSDCGEYFMIELEIDQETGDITAAKWLKRRS